MCCGRTDSIGMSGMVRFRGVSSTTSGEEETGKKLVIKQHRTDFQNEKFCNQPWRSIPIMGSLL